MIPAIRPQMNIHFHWCLYVRLMQQIRGVFIITPFVCLFVFSIYIPIWDTILLLKKASSETDCQNAGLFILYG